MKNNVGLNNITANNMDWGKTASFDVDIIGNGLDDMSSFQDFKTFLGGDIVAPTNRPTGFPSVSPTALPRPTKDAECLWNSQESKCFDEQFCEFRPGCFPVGDECCDYISQGEPTVVIITDAPTAAPRTKTPTNPTPAPSIIALLATQQPTMFGPGANLYLHYGKKHRLCFASYCIGYEIWRYLLFGPKQFF